jgi:hypothetical protein
MLSSVDPFVDAAELYTQGLNQGKAVVKAVVVYAAFRSISTATLQVVVAAESSLCGTKPNNAF